MHLGGNRAQAAGRACERLRDEGKPLSRSAYFHDTESSSLPAVVRWAHRLLYVAEGCERGWKVESFSLCGGAGEGWVCRQASGAVGDSRCERAGRTQSADRPDGQAGQDAALRSGGALCQGRAGARRSGLCRLVCRGRRGAGQRGAAADRQGRDRQIRQLGSQGLSTDLDADRRD